MSTQSAVPTGEPQAPAVNENETLETIGETTDQPVVATEGAGTSNEQAPEGGDAPGAQPVATSTTEDAAAKKEKSDVQKRIDTLTRRRYELEGRNEELEYELARVQRRLAAIEKGEAAAAGDTKPAAAAAVDPNKPARENFQTYEDWVEALSLYNANLALAQRDQALQARQQSQSQTALVQRWNESLEVARGKYEDFDTVVGSNVQLPQAAFNAIVDSPVGTDIAYYIGTHPEVAANMAKLSPIGVFKAIGRIEAQFEKETAEGASTAGSSTTSATAAASAHATAPAVAPGASKPAGTSARPQATQRPKPVTSAASAPVTPVGSRATNTGKNPDEMSYQEYKKWREENGRQGR